MKLFVWERINHVSNGYHNEGGVVAIAVSLERARELARENGVTDCNHDDDCYVNPDQTPSDLNRNPELTLEVASDEEKCFVFPDAGCC